MHKLTKASAIGALAIALLAGGSTVALAEDAPAAPAAPAGTFTDLGTPITSLVVHQAGFGTYADGTESMFALSDGENAVLSITDPVTNTLKRSFVLQGVAGAWGITTSSDGTVYLGTFNNGHLYRYEASSDSIVDLGQVVPNAKFIYGLTPGRDGKVYGGTYPDAHAFEYDPATGAFTDYGRVSQTQQYARAAAYDPEHDLLYVGLQAPTAGIVQVNPDTGEIKDVSPATPYGASVNFLTYADGKILAGIDNKLFVLDGSTGQAQPLTLASDGSTVANYPMNGMASPELDGAVYFTTIDGPARTLTRLDTATDTITPLTAADGTPLDAKGPGIGWGWLQTDGHPVLYAKIGNYGGDSMSFDPATDDLALFRAPLVPSVSGLSTLWVNPADDKLWVNAGLGGATVVYDPSTGTSANATNLGQIEAWTEHGGQLFTGTYPNGSVAQCTQTATTKVSCTALFSLLTDYQQNRPRGLAVTDDRVYAGTTPGYGLYGGALTVYDRASRQFAVNRNVIQDQSIVTLLADGATLYGGSSIEGGEGTSPKATEAKLFTWDTATDTKTGEYTIVPGAHAINALTQGPDGNVWGFADGTVFVFSPATKQLVKTIKVFDGYTGSGDGALIFHPNGYIYGQNAGRMFVIDPVTDAVTMLRDGDATHLVMTSDGTLYTLVRPAGALSRTNLFGYTPDPTAPAWSSGTAYAGGETVSHGSARYTALWQSQGETPGASPWGAWAEVGNPVSCGRGIVSEWTSSFVYTGGEQVLADGHVYRAQWWTRNQTPGDSSGPWVDLGAC